MKVSDNKNKVLDIHLVDPRFTLSMQRRIDPPVLVPNTLICLMRSCINDLSSGVVAM